MIAPQILALFFRPVVTVAKAGKDDREKSGRIIVTLSQVALIWEVLTGVFTRNRLFYL